MAWTGLTTHEVTPAGNSYIRWEFAGYSVSGKTQVWDCVSESSGTVLGCIAWFGRWRQYTFFPRPEMVFNVHCLRNIAYAADGLNSRHKAARKGTL